MNQKTLKFFLLLFIFSLLSGGEFQKIFSINIAQAQDFDEAAFREMCEGQGGRVIWNSENLPECVGMGRTQPPPPPTRSYAELEAERRGKAHWDNKNWAQAIAEYQLALSYCQFSCEAYRQNITWATVYFHEAVGDKYWNEKNWSGVIRAYLQAFNFCTSSMDCGWLRRDMSRAKVYQQTAIAGSYFDQNNWSEAIYAFEAALQLCIPSMDCNWIRNNISTAWENLENENARTARNTWAYEGSRHWDDENWADAISAYKEALRNCNSSMNCDYLRSNIAKVRENQAEEKATKSWNAGNWASAISDYQEALRQCNNHGGTCSYLIDIIARGRGNIERDKAQLFIENENWGAAESAARAAARYCNSQVSCSNITDMVPNARKNKLAAEADRHWKNSNWEAAIKNYRAALSHCTSRMSCEYLEDNLKRATINFDNQDFKRGGEAYDQGNMEEALEFYERALEKDDPSWALNRKGYILSELGREDEALEAYALAYIKDPSNLSAAWNISINLGPEDLDLKIMLLENSILINSEETNSEIYIETLGLLEDLKDRRSSFFYDVDYVINGVANTVSEFFNSDETPEDQLPKVGMDQLIQARNHGELATIGSKAITKDWRLTFDPRASENPGESASFQASMIFDRGKNYNPNEIVFGSQVPDISRVNVPDVEGAPVDALSEIPTIDLSTIPFEVKSQPQWKRFEQQAALLGQDYTKQKNTLETLKAKAPTLPEASPERQEVEKAIEQTETDLGNTKGSMKKVEKKMMDFFISFKEEPKPPDPEEEAQ